MADEIDQANDLAQHERDKLVAMARLAVPLPYKGCCYNCGEDLEHPHRFCDVDCRDDFELRHKMGVARWASR